MKNEDDAASEVLLTMAFGYLLLWVELKGVKHWPLKSLDKQKGKSGQRPTADFVLHVADTKTTHILEFKMKATRQNKTLANQLAKALQQVVNYKELVMDGHTGLYSVVVFDDSGPSGAVEAITNPRTEEQVSQLLEELQAPKKQGRKYSARPGQTLLI